MLMIAKVLKQGGALDFSLIYKGMNQIDIVWIQVIIGLDILLWIYLYVSMKCFKSTAFDRYIEVILPISIIIMSLLLGQIHQRWLKWAENEKPWYSFLLYLMFHSSHSCVFIHLPGFRWMYESRVSEYET